jgi:hypothetical protein
MKGNQAMPSVADLDADIIRRWMTEDAAMTSLSPEHLADRLAIVEKLRRLALEGEQYQEVKAKVAQIREALDRM